MHGPINPLAVVLSIPTFKIADANLVVKLIKIKSIMTSYDVKNPPSWKFASHLGLFHHFRKDSKLAKNGWNEL